MESAKSSIKSEKISLQTEALSKLVCPVCYEYMKPPIMQCENEHGICELCHELLSECPVCQSALTHRRSSHLETLTSLVLFPCKKCKKHFSLDDLNRHKCIPEDITSICIIGQFHGNCAWNGPIQNMIDHCSSKHPENFWEKRENTAKWKYSTLSHIGIQNVFILDLTEAFFVIVQKFDSETQSLQWHVSCESEKNEQYVYEIELFCDSENGENSLTYRSKIDNDVNIMSFFPSGNEVVIPLDKVYTFLCDDYLNYKVKILKRSDVQDFTNMHYYKNSDGVKIVESESVKKSCRQKTCSPIIFVYRSIKGCLNC